MVVSTSITIIAVPAEDIDCFEAMYIDERRTTGAGWEMFPVRSARYLDGFLMKATSSDLGVIRSTDDRDDEGRALVSCLITRATVLEVVPDLESLAETKADETANALHVYGGSAGNLDRILHALKSGEWPTTGDPVEEAGAFTYQLLHFARIAKREQMGVCLEYRGQFMV